MHEENGLTADWSTLLGRSVEHPEALVLNHVVKVARRHPHVVGVVLFGSRARGDHRPTSDFDVAIELAKPVHEHFAAFCEELQETLPTIHAVDILDVASGLSPHLVTSIRHEGKRIYNGQV